MKVKKICKQCGKAMFFMPSRAKKNKGFCSRECMSENKIIKIKKTCPECGKIYLAQNQNERKRIFCSKKCFYENKKKRPLSRKQYFETKCTFCNKQLFRWRFELKRKHSFCNIGCQTNYYYNHPEELKNNEGKFKEGLHYSPKTEFKKGISQNPETEFKKGLIPWNKEIESTPEMKIHLNKLSAENWQNEKYLFNTLKGQMFGKSYKLTEFDKEIIRTRIRLFKIQRKEVIKND